MRLLLLLVLLISCGDAYAATIKWSYLPKARELSAKQRTEVQKVLESFNSYHGCQKSIAACLGQIAQQGALARRLGRYAVFLASKGLDAAAISKILEARRLSAMGPRKSIDLKDAPRLGPKEAKVIIVEYADFRCTHCAAVSPMLERLVKRYKGKVALYFKPYPLKIPGPSLDTAHAALAAARQGKFWPMHDALFGNRNDHDDAGLRKLAAKVGLDLARFDADMKDRSLLRLVERSKIEGIRLGLKGTPTLYFNGRRYRLRKDERHLKDRIDDELLLHGK